jgi:hypothetical protein
MPLQIYKALLQDRYLGSKRVLIVYGIARWCYREGADVQQSLGFACWTRQAKLQEKEVRREAEERSRFGRKDCEGGAINARRKDPCSEFRPSWQLR